MYVADGSRRPSYFSISRVPAMISESCRRAVSALLCASVTLMVSGLDACKGASQPHTAQAQQNQQQQAPQTTDAVPTADQLYQLVAPIALFPDNLLAQVLAASTYPNEVSEAYTWVQQNSNLKGQQLMEAANNQSWDPSVKGLTQFPDVLKQMATNLSWTSALGDAYYNYPESVMNAVQVMRQRAQQSGNLKTNQQQTVTVENQPPGQTPPPAPQGSEAATQQQTVIVQSPPQTIVIQPTQPTVVYVPTYNPTVVYGAPVAPYPGYSTGDMIATSLISFGVGVAVGAAISGGGCCGWGWNSWGCGWHNNTVVYNRNVYVSNSNTFVNRNNYYRNTNYNNTNINRNNINTNNINRNNINNNNVNRNNLNNNNYRTNNFNQGTYTEPKFNQKYDAPQYRNNNNLSENNRQNLGNTQQNRQQNFNQNRQQQNPGNTQQNRQNLSQNRPEASNQNWRNDGARGYGQQQTRGTSTSAFSNYGQGGNTRINSERGQQSYEGSRGNFGGNRGNGGGRRR